MRLIAALALVGCTGAEPVIETWQAPDEDGYWLAGSSDHSVTGASGVELVTQVWFPASDGDDDRIEYGGFMQGAAVEDGVPDCSEPRPVVVFSHGNGGIRFQSHFLTEHLARHGYVVVAPDHTGNTLFDLDDVPRPEMAIRRPVDLTDSFDWLVAEASDPASPLSGCVDSEAGFAVMGHSFGGYTTLATAGARLDLVRLQEHCAEGDDFLCGTETAWAEAFPGDDSGDLADPRAWAAVPLAPAGAIALEESTLAVPTLVIGGIEDELTTWDDEVQPIYAGLTTTPRALAGIEAAGHFTFTHLCTSGFDGCGEGAIDLDEAHDLIRIMALAWVDTARGEARSADWLPPAADNIRWESQ